MPSSSPLSFRARVYVTCVVVAGAFAIGQSVYELHSSPIPNSWIVLALLTLFSGTFAIRVPSVPAKISVSETFVFTAVLLFGVAAATVIVTLDGLIISLWRKRRNLHRILFNGAEPAISIWVASHIFFRLAGIHPLALVPLQVQTPGHTNDVAPLVLPLIVLTVVYFLLNSWLTAIVVWLETGNSAARLWRQHFLWLSLNYFGGASVALLIAGNTQHVSYFTLGLVIPLLVISYLTFSTALQRIEEEQSHNSHLNQLYVQLNDIYLSTIEAFAMSIDAKDQVTHDHISRVRGVAVGLAKHLGVADSGLLKAIEAAALLHDIGKLSVPERILNKPGKLSPSEFEVMKQHASEGAKILSKVPFPYPVVPIVQHHHENWDGTGYPQGLAATDIPIGARILAVVDCFDALTSDRPYRLKLSEQEATEILLERRGTMYDPLVVDAFMKIHRAPAEEPRASADADSKRTTISNAGEATVPAPRNLTVSGQQILSLHELAGSLSGNAGLAETADVVMRRVLEMIPARLCALFVYESETDEIVAVHSTGSAIGSLTGFRLPVGTAVSGWVAANRRPTVNADARVELSRSGSASLEELTRAHSAPLCVGDALVGVITFYSADNDNIASACTRSLELLLPHIARAVHQGIEFDRREGERLKDALTGLPHFATLAQFVAPKTSSGGPSPMVAVFLDVRHLDAVNQRYGTEMGDRVLMHVTEIVRGNLRTGDLLLRYGSDEFVALLTDSDVTTAECIASRLVESVSTSSFVLRDGASLRVQLVSGCAIAPRDGASLEILVKTARDRALHQTLAERSTIVH